MSEFLYVTLHGFLFVEEQPGIFLSKILKFKIQNVWLFCLGLKLFVTFNKQLLRRAAYKPFVIVAFNWYKTHMKPAKGLVFVGNMHYGFGDVQAILYNVPL